MAAAAVEDWLDHLQVERGVSPHTVAAYRRDVLAVMIAVGLEEPSREPIEALAAITRDRLLAWLYAERRGPRAATSTARRLAALRGFCRYAISMGLLQADPTEGLGSGRVPERLPRVLSRAAVGRLLASVTGERPMDLRDRALLEALYATGARVREACGWRVGDLRLRERVVRCLGKGRKERWVPVAAPAADALRSWLEDGRPHLDQGLSERIFLSRTGRRLDRHRVYRILQRQALAAGLDAEFGPHVLRHSCATHLLDGGADLRAVQELLGHASVRTTQVYTHVRQDRLKAVHRKHHPRG